MKLFQALGEVFNVTMKLFERLSQPFMNFLDLLKRKEVSVKNI